MDQHPEWLAVGRTVNIVRRLYRYVDHTQPATVVRHSKTSVFVRIRSDGTEYRFAAKRGEYHEIPRYLDYTTMLEPVA